MSNSHTDDHALPETGAIVRHPEFGTGRVLNVDEKGVAVNFMRAGVRQFTLRDAEMLLSPAEATADEEAEEVDIDELRAAIRDVLREEGLIGETTIGQKWEGGEMVLRPGNPSLKEKSIPIESFFHKVVMVRDRLRLLEQSINSSKTLSETEKIDMQQYITRCYGSLTTFNVLFGEKEDWFVGEKGSRD